MPLVYILAVLAASVLLVPPPVAAQTAPPTGESAWVAMSGGDNTVVFLDQQSVDAFPGGRTAEIWRTYAGPVAASGAPYDEAVERVRAECGANRLTTQTVARWLQTEPVTLTLGDVERSEPLPVRFGGDVPRATVNLHRALLDELCRRAVPSGLDAPSELPPLRPPNDDGSVIPTVAGVCASGTEHILSNVSYDTITESGLIVLESLIHRDGGRRQTRVIQSPTAALGLAARDALSQCQRRHPVIAAGDEPAYRRTLDSVRVETPAERLAARRFDPPPPNVIEGGRPLGSVTFPVRTVVDRSDLRVSIVGEVRQRPSEVYWVSGEGDSVRNVLSWWSWLEPQGLGSARYTSTRRALTIDCQHGLVLKETQRRMLGRRVVEAFQIREAVVGHEAVEGERGGRPWAGGSAEDALAQAVCDTDLSESSGASPWDGTSAIIPLRDASGGSPPQLLGGMAALRHRVRALGVAAATVTAEFVIKADGRAAEITLTGAPDERTQTAVMDALGAARFRPRIAGRRPVQSRARLAIDL